MIGYLAAAVLLSTVAPAEAQQKLARDGGTTEILIPYSVAVASYGSYERAAARARALSSTETLVYVAPVSVRGRVYYRVLAGLLKDRYEASALADRLVDQGAKERKTAWDIRPTLFAFRFATLPTRQDAAAELQRLRGLRIPAYTVTAVADDGTADYHIYAGGYETRAEARALEEQIRLAGEAGDLVERVGYLGSLPEMIVSSEVPDSVAQPEPVPPPPPASTPPSTPRRPGDAPTEPVFFPAPVAEPTSSERPQPARGMAGFIGRSTTFGARAGVLNPGCVYINESACFDGNFGYSIGIFVDQRLVGALLIGLAAELHGLDDKEADVHTSEMIDLSLNLKAQLGSPRGRVALRPGVGAGYGSAEVLGDRVDHMTLRAFLEAIFPTRSRVSWMSEVAVYGAIGDSANLDTSFGPGLMFRAGVVF